MKIGVDVQMPQKIPPEFDFDVVYQAMDGEEDQEWIDFARSLGADVIVTPDIEAGIYARSVGLTVVLLPWGLRGKSNWEFVYGVLGQGLKKES